MTTEGEMVACHHQLSGHEFGFEQALGVDGQGSVACCMQSMRSQRGSHDSD